MRRKQNTHNIPAVAVSSAGCTGDLIEDYNELLEQFRGSLAVVLNYIPNGQHKLVLDSPDLGEITYHFARKGGRIVFSEDFSEFLEAITGRLILSSEATLFLSSYKDESPEEEILVSPDARRDVRVWLVRHGGKSIISLNSHQGKRHTKNTFMSLRTGKVSYKDAWDIS